MKVFQRLSDRMLSAFVPNATAGACYAMNRCSQCAGPHYKRCSYLCCANGCVLQSCTSCYGGC